MASDKQPPNAESTENNLEPQSLTAGTSIRLDDYLKYCGVVGTGGQAKILIQSGEVRVNGQVETRRRRQLQLGDTIELLGESFIVEQ